MAARLRHAAVIGLLAAGLVAAFITACGVRQLKAQSFNCRYARHSVERAICQDPMLGQLDEELASVYRRLLLRLPKEEGKQLYKEEDAFVLFRNRCGAQRACIEESYRRRIRELEEAWENGNRPQLGRSAVTLNDGPFLSERIIAGVDFAA